MASMHPNKADRKIDRKKKSHANDPLILKRAKEAETFLKKAGLPQRIEQRIKEPAE